MEKNKKANFWIKLLTRIIDFFIVLMISIGLLFIFMNKENGIWVFKSNWMYYLWSVIVSSLFILTTIAIPSLTKGKTIAMYITRIKIVYKEKSNIWFSNFKREIVFGFAWSMIVLLSMAVLTHELIGKFALRPKSSDFSNLDMMRIQFVSVISSFLILVQLIFAISNIVRNDKRGLEDVISSTNVVWVNKFEKNDNEEDEAVLISPIKVVKPNIEWIEE